MILPLLLYTASSMALAPRSLPDLIVGKTIVKHSQFNELDQVRNQSEREKVLAKYGWTELSRPKCNLLLNEDELGFTKIRAKILLLRWLATRKDQHYGYFHLSEVPKAKSIWAPNGLREALLDLFRDGDPVRAPYLIKTAKDLRFQIQVNTILQLEADGNAGELNLTPSSSKNLEMVRGAMLEIEDPEAMEKAVREAGMALGRTYQDLGDRVVVSYAPNSEKPQAMLDLVVDAHETVRKRLDEIEREQAAALKDALDALVTNSEPTAFKDFNSYIGQRPYGTLVGSNGIGLLRSLPPKLDNPGGWDSFLRGATIKGWYRTASIVLLYGNATDSTTSQSYDRIIIQLK
ncbi:MAG: hypothetical protein ACOYON_09015 [Fimbriimonas sp.]